MSLDFYRGSLWALRELVKRPDPLPKKPTATKVIVLKWWQTEKRKSA